MNEVHLNLSRLTDKIERNIKDNFVDVHLSGNLMETIVVRRISNGHYEVEIPAEMYDLAEYYDKGVITYTHKGSYAQQVDEQGGFSGLHINYVESAIIKAVYEQLAEQRIDGSVKIL